MFSRCVGRGDDLLYGAGTARELLLGAPGGQGGERLRNCLRLDEVSPKKRKTKIVVVLHIAMLVLLPSVL
jgi:hypothetical protein